MSILMWTSILISQDLWAQARAAQPIEPDVRFSKGRLDLVLGPFVDPMTGEVQPATIGVDLKRVFGVRGRFSDIATFRSLFKKHAREEYLDGVIERAQEELAGSSLVLACQMFPLWCDALKHYKVMTNESLARILDDVTSLERASTGLPEMVRARAVMNCLAERTAAGTPLDEALKECHRKHDFRGLLGDKVKEIDVMKEVRKALGLSKESERKVAELAGDVKVGEEGIQSEVHLRSVTRVYDARRRDFENAWNRAIEASARGAAPNEALAELAPAGAPAVTPAEVQRLALMNDVDRRVVVGAIAAAMALQETARRSAEAQEALEAAASVAADPALKEILRAEAARVGSEFRRLRERHELGDLVAKARLRADAAAREDGETSFRRAADAWWKDARGSEIRRDGAPWGAGCSKNRGIGGAKK
ncbi:MAG: hypothetical protein HY716_05645 [Planctomycetes bacterium]|nr:hypothetical protein [Planctomycetota bacterium]